MPDSKVDWPAIFRAAWDETPFLRPRYTAGSLAVTVLAQVFAWLANASVQSVMTNAILFGLTAWFSVSVVWYATNLVRVPAHQLASALHENAGYKKLWIEGSALIPKLTIKKADPRPQDDENFYLFVEIDNPGPPTTLKRDWRLQLTSPDGGMSLHRGSSPFDGRLESGHAYEARVIFRKNKTLGTAQLSVARYSLTVPDIHGHTLRDAWGPIHV